MTYTFKLARRLAVSRTFGMLPVILLFAACGGDATAPEHSTSPQDDWRPREAVPVAVSVNPNKVTVETNQLIRFLAHGTNSSGDSVGALVQWSATGGTILPDGRFSAAATGTFMVVGRVSRREQDRVDTAVVEVVRRQVKLASLRIDPGTTTLAPGLSQTFLATGYLKDGRAVPIGATWTATGGTIDAGGKYVAGDTAGTYQVIATHTVLAVADTATITITAPAAAPPSLPPAAPPVALASVTLVPGTATLAPFATRQFTAYGRTTEGDSVSVSVVFAATGGTVTAGGLYTAGSTAGSYRIIATFGSLADTSSLTVTFPLGSGPATGIPFGPLGALGWIDEPNTYGFTLGMSSVTPANIAAKIATARAKGVKLVLAMTGGRHDLHMSMIRDTLRFDRAKWDRTMDGFNTPAIKAAVAAGVADGTIIGNSVMDEPHVSGAGDGNTWGPKGTMTKVRVDSLCGYVKQIFPTLPVGVAHPWQAFESSKSYRVCEFIASQYASRIGSVTAWRDGALAMGRRDGIAMLFSMNILNGGTQDRDGIWDCPTSEKGTYAPNCWMTPNQVRTIGTTLGPAGCGLLMWRYDVAFTAKPENRQAFRDVADYLATVPAKSCRR